MCMAYSWYSVTSLYLDLTGVRIIRGVESARRDHERVRLFRGRGN